MSAGSDGFVPGAGIATDRRGDSYVTGSFQDTTTFGAGGPNQTVLEAVASVLFPFRRDMFLAKYATDGSFAWARSAGGISEVRGSAVATDPQGNSYVTGSIDCANVFGIMCTATFGAGEANETVLEPKAEGGSNIFVAKYARDGALLWATIAGGSFRAGGWGIATDRRGNSYVAGSFDGTVTFGAGEANETVLEPYPGTGLFVAKYAPDGTFLWARSAGATEVSEEGVVVSVFGAAIATDARGNSYVTGSLECEFFSRDGATCPATFGAGEPKETVLEAGLAEVVLFVAKYAPDGTLVWARSPRGDQDSFIRSSAIAADTHGNTYLTGHFDCGALPGADCTATFGAGERNQTVVDFSPDETVDILLAKYAPDGSLAWAKRVGGADQERGTGIATNLRGDSYVTGSFAGTTTFGAGEANETVLENAGGIDVFVAKYARDGTLLWATSAGGESDFSSAGGNDIATDPRGNSYVTGFFGGTVTFGAGEANETVLEGGDMFVAKYRDRTPPRRR